MGSGQVLGQTASPSTSSYSLLLTTDPGHIRAAQELRNRVYAEEFGCAADSATTGRDRYDALCDHLVVRENCSGDVVGAHRLLPPDAAGAAGGLHAEGEFDCAALDRIRVGLVETGHPFVAPEHRSGLVAGLVWAGVLRYLLLTRNRWLVGCAGVALADGGALASGVWHRVRTRHLSPARYRLRPLRPWTLEAVPVGTTTLLPPLLRGYLRLGAWVCGPPAHDPVLGCADFPMLLDAGRLDARYARHLLGTGS